MAEPIGDDMPVDDAWLNEMKQVTVYGIGDAIETGPVYHLVPQMGDKVKHNDRDYTITFVHCSESTDELIPTAVLNFSVTATTRKAFRVMPMSAHRLADLVDQLEHVYDTLPATVPTQSNTLSNVISELNDIIAKSKDES